MNSDAPGETRDLLAHSHAAVRGSFPDADGCTASARVVDAVSDSGGLSSNPLANANRPAIALPRIGSGR